MFEMRAIEKNFDAVRALNGASLKVNPGEIMALLGSNGSGKSTMIKVLAGLVSPDKGEVLIDGKPVTITSGFDSRELGIATAFQDLSLIPTMTVMDNILLGHEPVGKFGLVNQKEARQEIKDLLEYFEIKVSLDAYVQNLPPSTQTMLEVAKAYALKPRLLLLDEVTAALHNDETKRVFEVMKELKEQGTAIVYVTHRMSEIFEVCDKATIMRGGETIEEGDIKDMSLDDIVYYMTGQRVESSATQAQEHEFEGTGDPVVDVEHMEVYPKVKDVSLKAYAGEIIGIGGLQGQGQSELIRALLGAEPLTSGTYLFNGEEIHLKSPAQAVKAGIGFVSGERNVEAMFPIRSIQENIAAGKIANGKEIDYVSSKSLKEFSQDAVEKYNIKIGRLRDPASSLSGGNQQKLVVARWIAMKPKLLLLDDPTKGVDINSRREIHKILKQCAHEEGMTVIISSSDSEELLSISDRVYVLYEGKDNAMLAGPALTNDRLVAAMMNMNQKEGKEETTNG